MEASLKDHTTVGVLLLHVSGAFHAELEQITGKVASYSTRAACSRSDLVIFPPRLSKLTKFSYIFFDHCMCHVQLCPSRFGPSYTPPAPNPEASVYPISDGSC